LCVNSQDLSHHLASSETAARSTSLGVAFHLATLATDRVLGHGTELCSSVSQCLHNTRSVDNAICLLNPRLALWERLQNARVADGLVNRLWIMQSPLDSIGSSYIDTELCHGCRSVKVNCRKPAASCSTIDLLFLLMNCPRYVVESSYRDVHGASRIGVWYCSLDMPGRSVGTTVGIIPRTCRSARGNQ
jgi:hypothetical protein